MIIGIDVGGTHADGVLLHRGNVLKKRKEAVAHVSLENALISLLEYLLPDDKTDLKKIHLSTTLCTNAIVNNALPRVGMFIRAGPGVNPEFLNCGEDIVFLDGALDHRGQELKSPSLQKIEKGIERWKEEKIDTVGAVTKFSHRNNAHEQLISEKLSESFSFISTGHQLSGMPNFPRRVYTTWLNSALQPVFSSFKNSMTKALDQLGVNCPVLFLKADGGTFPFSLASTFPCQTVHSGPSASVIGGLALMDNKQKDRILLDIGGTTTDICFFADDIPLLEPYGATVVGRPTLIRALHSRSIGLGGDSALDYNEEQYIIGPHRNGPPMTFGGDHPTPTDALKVLDKCETGNHEKACKAMRLLRPDQPEKDTAHQILQEFARQVDDHVRKMIYEVFSRPVFSIKELLERKKLHPVELILVGGPAKGLRDVMEEKFDLSCVVPDNFEVANAIGVGRARQTWQASLYADTALGTLSIPEASIVQDVGRSFTMADGEQLLEKVIIDEVGTWGKNKRPKIDFLERLEMNTVSGFSSTGKIISLKAQVRPGLEDYEEVYP